MHRSCSPPPIVLQAVVAAYICVGLASATCAFRFAGYPNISELPTFTLPPAELDSTTVSRGDWTLSTEASILYIGESAGVSWERTTDHGSFGMGCAAPGGRLKRLRAEGDYDEREGKGSHPSSLLVVYQEYAMYNSNSTCLLYTCSSYRVTIIL